MTHEHSRRRFIKTVLLASGAVFTNWNDLLAGGSVPPHDEAGSLHAEFETLNFKTAHQILRDGKRKISFPKANETVDCVIIGGGISGLAAAWRLMKEGKSFVVLDGEPKMGGAARFGEWKGKRYPVGAGYFVTWDGIYKQIYEDIGVKPVSTGEDALWYGPDGMHVDWWNDQNLATLPISADDKDAFKKYRDVLIKLDPFPDYPLVNASKDNIAKYDTISAKSYIEQFGSKELLEWMDMYSYSACGTSLDQANAYCFLNFYQAEFGKEFDLPRFTYPGGMVGTIEKFAQHIGEKNIRLSSLVLHITNVHDGVEIGYMDAEGAPRKIKARTAISALEKKIAHHMIPEMPKKQKQVFSEVRYDPYITVNLLCDAPLFPKRAFDTWFRDKDLIFTDMVDGFLSTDFQNGTPDRMQGDFAYCVYCPRPENKRWFLQDERYVAEYAQKVAQQVAKYVPNAMDVIQEMHVFTWGHTMVIPYIGSHSSLFPLISQPCGNIFFANTDNDLSPSAESGIINGHWAAEQAIKKMA
ncbi:MAG TPA: FAD-dependent oxidoreductase [Candidatus Kapabacteria bacterium]|nr:FAD-dependent oxidoreductase [Candidatus Kapabacteria bacterium]